MTGASLTAGLGRNVLLPSAPFPDAGGLPDVLGPHGVQPSPAVAAADSLQLSDAVGRAIPAVLGVQEHSGERPARCSTADPHEVAVVQRDSLRVLNAEPAARESQVGAATLAVVLPVADPLDT